jgi:hypothetical protein
MRLSDKRHQMVRPKERFKTEVFDRLRQAEKALPAKVFLPFDHDSDVSHIDLQTENGYPLSKA